MCTFKNLEEILKKKGWQPCLWNYLNLISKSEKLVRNKNLKYSLYLVIYVKNKINL